MEKLDLSKILKDCPSGMELDCLMYEDVYFDYVDELNIIHCYIQHEPHKTSITFNQHGTYNSDVKSKCVIFPKGKTTWEGFQKPFVEGDVVYAKVDGASYIIIYQKQIDERVYRHVCLCLETYMFGCDKDCIFTDDPIEEWRLATEEEKAKLFQVIKDKGYKWDPETKTLEKVTVPKFKVGDKIRHKTTNSDCILEISRVYNDSYGLVSCSWMLSMEYQNEYELVPNKFNPKTLQHFDKVLVTDALHDEWCAGFFSHINTSRDYQFVVDSRHWRYCIPYNNDTKHLTGKSGKVPEFYRYWK